MQPQDRKTISMYEELVASFFNRNIVDQRILDAGKPTFSTSVNLFTPTLAKLTIGLKRGNFSIQTSQQTQETETNPANQKTLLESFQKHFSEHGIPFETRELPPSSTNPYTLEIICYAQIVNPEYPRAYFLQQEGIDEYPLSASAAYLKRFTELAHDENFNSAAKSSFGKTPTHIQAIRSKFPIFTINLEYENDADTKAFELYSIAKEARDKPGFFTSLFNLRDPEVTKFYEMACNEYEMDHPELKLANSAAAECPQPN